MLHACFKERERKYAQPDEIISAKYFEVLYYDASAEPKSQ